MPYLRSYRTHCPHCGWRGRVGFGDVVGGPWLRADGTLFYPELSCPTCKKQVHNPLPEPRAPVAVITHEQEEEFKNPPTLSELMARAKRRKAAQENDAALASESTLTAIRCKRCYWRGALPTNHQGRLLFCPRCWKLATPVAGFSIESSLGRWIVEVEARGLRFWLGQWTTLATSVLGLVLVFQSYSYGLLTCLSGVGASSLLTVYQARWTLKLAQRGGGWAPERPKKHP